VPRDPTWSSADFWRDALDADFLAGFEPDFREVPERLVDDLGTGKSCSFRAFRAGGAAEGAAARPKRL